MSLRLELFVADLDRSVEFYRSVLGFEVDRHEEAYASVRAGTVVLGLAPVAGLPAARAGRPGTRGTGVEVVLEVDDLTAAAERVAAAGHPLADPVRRRPWGLTDFRLLDPDGYYLRITTR